MPDSQTFLLQRFSRLTDEFRRVISEDIKHAFKRPYYNALEAMLRAHWSNREESFFYRFFDRSWLLPLSSFLGGIKAFSDQIEDKGVSAAASDLFRKMGVKLKVSLPLPVRLILEREHPTLLVGEHPSRLGFDFFAVAASLSNFWKNKAEPRLLALPSTIGICPGLRNSAFPVVMTRQQELKVVTGEGGQRPMLAELWVPEVERRQAHDITTISLDEAIDYWLGGGHIVLFPNHGLKGGKWLLGIGRMILEAMQRLDKNNHIDPHIVFFHLNGAKDILIVNPPFMSRFHPAHIALGGNSRKVTVQYQKFFSLRECEPIFSSMNKQTLTHYLQLQYQQV